MEQKNRYRPNLLPRRRSSTTHNPFKPAARTNEGSYPATVLVDSDTVVCLWPSQAKECWISFRENQQYQKAVDSLCALEAINNQKAQATQQELETTKRDLRRAKTKLFFTRLSAFAVAVGFIYILFK